MNLFAATQLTLSSRIMRAPKAVASHRVQSMSIPPVNSQMRKTS